MSVRHCAAEGAGGPASSLAGRGAHLPQARETRTCFSHAATIKVYRSLADELALNFVKDPESLSPIQKAKWFVYLHISSMCSNDIDFNNHNQLMEADPETLQAITKRVISTGQFLPHWFLQRYMEVDSGACVRALLAGGRAVEAGAACDDQPARSHL
ncbi:hypothetical protein EVAR_75210_1 [Eumeta japonica]|uniref:Uncharacterized protein n=1 Tax=Eumeta variegata TaxID=151549 RepID=A0A4C2AC06_EUMVA|nr:hypothetical protein EVAR_75210_1 [Eumeta japonica]